MASAAEFADDWDLLSFSFDSFFRDWHQHPEKPVFIPEIFSTSVGETEIMLQPSIDTAKENSPNYVAVSKVFMMLQKVQEVEKIGGIFVARFDMLKLYRKIRTLQNNKGDQEKLLYEWRKWVIRNGETAEENILVLHPQLGIVLLAVPAHYGTEKFSEQYNMAKEAVDDCENILSRLFCILAIAENCDVEINGIVCLPDAFAENNEVLPNHIYKNSFEDIGHFAKFWSHRIGESVQKHGQRNYYENSAFQQFARFIVSYRSTAAVAAARNAHEVYRHLAKEALSGDERRNKSVFCLNPIQLSSYLSVNKHQILFGLPGTGKTLLLMILATRAKIVGEGKPGKVVIITGGRRLIKKYEDSIQGVSTKRKLIVRDNCTKLNEISDDDDFFTDEMQSIAGDWLKFLEKRSKLNNVFTVVAVSGRAWATDVDGIMASTKNKPELKEYFLVNLTTVVRGTKHIIEYWSNKFLHFVPPIGHSDVGEPVIEEFEGTTDGVLIQVKKHVRLFLAANFAPCNIAILTFNEWASRDVEKYLNDQDIKACSAQKAQQLGQNEYSKNIKVDFNNNVLSQEYPAVIVVNYYGYMGTSESTEFTALTRAIARLVVLKKDRMKIQRQIDEIMQMPENLGNRNVDMFKIVKEAAEELCAREPAAIEWRESLKAPIGEWKREHEAANNWDQSLAELRYNILPAKLKENEHFRECKKFSDVFRALIENKKAMHDYLKTHVPEDHPFYPYKVAHSRLQQFNLEDTLGPNMLDVKDQEMRETILRFYDHYLASLEGFLNNTSIEDRQKNHIYLADSAKWQAITRAMFTLGYDRLDSRPN